MALSYALRVACLIGVSLGLLQMTIELLLWAAAPMLLRGMRSLSVRHRERGLYLAQLAPAAIALVLTAVFFLPQYVSNETNLAPERVSWLCIALAAGVYLWWTARILGGLRMAIRTVRFSRAYRLGGEASTEQTPIVTVAGSTPRVALVGLVQPFIILSQSLLDAGGLAPLALEVVLDHERSHAAQRDNWKLLTLHCVPRLNLRLASGKTWMQLWQTTAEWAADEDAVGGSDTRALVLAETLVALARSSSAPMPKVACTYLLCADTELSARVERLLHRTPVIASPHSYRVGAVLCFAALAGAAFLATLSSVLRYLPEQLLHLG